MYQSRKLSIFETGKAYSLSGLLLLFLVATSTVVHGQQPNAPGAEEPPERVWKPSGSLMVGDEVEDSDVHERSIDENT